MNLYVVFVAPDFNSWSLNSFFITMLSPCRVFPSRDEMICAEIE
jgi:hypothetical protein